MSGMSMSEIPVRINPDLQEERDQARFNVTELTHIVDGGVDKTQRRKKIEKIVFSDPDFLAFPRNRTFSSQYELYGSSVLKSIKLFKLRRQYKWTDEEFDIVLRTVNHDHSLSLHDSMFVPAIERLASDEQKARWLPAAKQYRMIGTYAQTEMGHGTYLQGLETTATYDSQTQEFILNTPSISAMKWWPGSLGKSSNHAIVLATLIIRGKSYGMHPFLIQLRSTENHLPLPGVKVGAIGPKMGINSVDNGYLMLQNYRIPRTNMLMKNAQVSPDGQFTSHTPSKANYATMILVRVQICNWCFDIMAQGSTIAIRYAAVRRQSKINPKERESKILEYQTQQYKLFPGLAMAYAFLFTSRSLNRKYEVAFKQIQNGNFKSLPELHCESAGMKAFCTELTIRELEIQRQSCGGHGYLNAAGLAVGINSSKPLITVEGENTVLYLQVARYLLKRLAEALSGRTLDGCTSYLSSNPDSFLSPITSQRDCTNLRAYCQLYQNRAYMAVASVAKQVQNDMENGIAQHDAINRNLVDLVRAAKAHCYYCVVKDFVEGVETLKASDAIVKVMRTLCCFFAVHGVAEQSGDFLESGAIGLDQLKWIKALQLTLLADIRPDAVALVDAFDYHDVTLSSVLGCYDGNAYERLFQSTKYDPMNKEEVHPSYFKYIKPFMEEMKSKL